MLTVSCRHIQHFALHRQQTKITFGPDDTGRLIQVETAVSVARHQAVADHVVGVKVYGREGDYLAAEGQGPRDLANACLTLKLKKDNIV